MFVAAPNDRDSYHDVAGAIPANEEKRRSSQSSEHKITVQQAVTEAWSLLSQLPEAIRRPSRRVKIGEDFSRRRNLYRLFVAVKHHECDPALWDGFSTLLQRPAAELKKDWMTTSDITYQQAKRMLQLESPKASIIARMPADIIFNVTTFLASGDVDTIATLHPELLVWERYCYLSQPLDWNANRHGVDPLHAAIDTMPIETRRNAWRILGQQLADGYGEPWVATVLCNNDANSAPTEAPVTNDRAILSNGYVVRVIASVPPETGYRLQVRSPDDRFVTTCARNCHVLKHLCALSDNQFAVNHDGIAEIWEPSEGISTWVKGKTMVPRANVSIRHWPDSVAVCTTLLPLPDGRLAVADTWNRVHFWDYMLGTVAYGPFPQGLAGPMGETALFSLPEGKIAAVYKDAVRIWGTNQHLLARLPHPSKFFSRAAIKSIVMTESRNILVCYQNTTVLWKPNTTPLSRSALTFEDDLS